MSSFEDLTYPTGPLTVIIPKRTASDSPLPPLPCRDADTTTRAIPQITPEKIDLIARDLSECRINASFITKYLNDQGKIIKCITEIQEALATRQQDLVFYLNRITTTPNFYSPQSSPNTHTPTTAIQLSPLGADPSPNALCSCLFELQQSASVLNEKLKYYRAKPAFGILWANNLMRLSYISRKNKLLEFTSALHDAWINLLIQLTLSISRASSEAATFANGNINKLAVAAGAEDWNELSVEDSHSYFIQGEKYFLGFGVPKSYDLAFKRYHMAAKLGLPTAAVMLGTMYENGYGQHKDYSNALKWYKVAASSYDAEALYNLGRLYEYGTGCEVSNDSAFTYYKQAAELGHLDGITSYGRFLQTGKGCETDYKSAFTQFKAAADKDHAKAQNYLATCFFLGRGVPIDYHKAVFYFKKASEKGFAAAFNNIGICYEEGAGVTKDLLSAQLNYSIAADLHHPGGMNNLGYLYMIDNHFDKALKCFNMAYSLGNVDALYNLGTLYEEGRPVSGSARNQEIETAIIYYKDGALQGCIKSQLRLGALLSEDSPIQDINAAKEYLLMAATDNNKSKNLKDLSSLKLVSPTDKFQVEAQNLLGEYYEIYSSCNSDLEEAAKWYLQASRSGHSRAAFNLGNLYETGQGVEKDFKKALSLYQEAIIRGSAEATFRIKELQELDLV